MYGTFLFDEFPGLGFHQVGFYWQIATICQFDENPPFCKQMRDSRMKVATYTQR